MPDLKLPERKPIEVQKSSPPKIAPFVQVQAKQKATFLPRKITAPVRADVHTDSFKVSEMADAYPIRIPQILMHAFLDLLSEKYRYFRRERRRSNAMDEMIANLES